MTESEMKKIHKKMKEQLPKLFSLDTMVLVEIERDLMNSFKNLVEVLDKTESFIDYGRAEIIKELKWALTYETAYIRGGAL